MPSVSWARSRQTEISDPCQRAGDKRQEATARNRRHEDVRNLLAFHRQTSRALAVDVVIQAQQDNAGPQYCDRCDSNREVSQDQIEVTLERTGRRELGLIDVEIARCILAECGAEPDAKR